MDTTNIHCDMTIIYKDYRKAVENFFFSRVQNRMDSEDMTQDLFIRLMDYDRMLRADTVKSFIFTIARNMIIDYYRHFYKRLEVEDYVIQQEKNVCYEMEQKIIARNIESFEQNKLKLFPPQRRKIYYLNRYKEYSVNEISEEMSISKRTVENHLRIGRKEMREYLRKTL